MKSSTVAVLDRVNRDFYRRRASEFIAKRKWPWPGWEKVFELIIANLGSGLDRARISVLDLGCGNGRVLPELARAFGQGISYLGVDASVPLLACAPVAARSAGHFRAHLVAADLARAPLAELGTKCRFEVVLAFGLLHHLPSFRIRREVLAAAAARLQPGGLLAASFWQFGDRERFQRRLVTWDALPAGAGHVDPADLEDGDHLLAWGDEGAVRYCHHATPAEADRLLAAAGLSSVASFSADGESGSLNLYHLCSGRPDSRPGVDRRPRPRV